MTLSPRAQAALDAAPEYYAYSTAFANIQTAVAAEYDTIDNTNEDIQAQLYIITATWGLKYWEEELGIPTNLSDSYEIRRSRVMAAWRQVGQFSAKLIESIAESFTNGDVEVKLFMRNLSKDPDVGNTTGVATVVGADITVIPGQLYAVSFDRSATSHTNGLQIRFKDKNGAVITSTIDSWTYSGSYTAHYLTPIEGRNCHFFIAPANSATVQVNHYIASGSTLSYVKNVMLELFKETTNLLGYDGNFETLNGMTFTNGTGAVDSTRKTKGSNSVKVTKSDLATFIDPTKRIYPSSGEHYLTIAEIYQEAAGNSNLMEAVTNGVTFATTKDVTSVSNGDWPATTVGAFIPVIRAGEIGSVTTPGTSYMCPRHTHSGTIGQVYNIDAWRTYKITKEEYDALPTLVDLATAQSIAEKYAYSEPVFEQRKEFTIGVRFIGARGIPVNLDDLKAAIDNVVHAHLGIEYSFTYLTWGELDAANKTWADINAINITWKDYESWKPA